MGAAPPDPTAIDPRIADPVEAATGARALALSPLSGGCIAEIYRVALSDGGNCVAKLAASDASGALALEGWMLRYLRDNSALPVPTVLHCNDDLLVIEYIETGGPLDDRAERHAADLLAALHDITAPRFGLERDTLIGPLHQPNPWSETWLPFFRDHRLLAMGRRALDAGHLSAASFGRLENLCGKLSAYIDEPPAAVLIHGDMWGGNVLARDGHIAGFVDPAIYFADAEIELAFSTLFGTFGDAFFARYNEQRPLAPGFFEVRRELYNLYPLLVHTTLFGGHYAQAVERTLGRYA